MQSDEALKLKKHRIFLLGNALNLVWQSDPSWTIARMALLVVQSILPLLSLYLMKVIIDAVSTGIASPNKETAFQQIVLLIALIGTVNLVIAFCSSIADLVNTTQTEKINDYMHGIVHAKAIEVDLEYYENSLYYDTLKRAQQEAYYPRISHKLIREADLGRKSWTF